MSKTAIQKIADIDTKIAALNVTRAELVVASENEVDPAKLVSGAVVTFNYGKGKDVRVLEGSIIGVKPADPAVPKSATLLRVAVGEGFDAQIVTIYPASVTKIAAIEAPAAE